MTTRKVARSASSLDKRCAGDFANRQLHHAAGHDHEICTALEFEVLPLLRALKSLTHPQAYPPLADICLREGVQKRVHGCGGKSSASGGVETIR